MTLRLENRSGYDTEDLRRFVRRGLRACGVRGDVHVTIVASPIRSRGCATVGGRKMVLAVASPARTTKREFIRRLARLLEHEAVHILGGEHPHMPQHQPCFVSRHAPHERGSCLYSLGSTPSWARGMKIRYRRRAPDQLAVLRAPADQRAGRSAARDFDKKALAREIDKDHRAAERAKLVLLREKIAKAREQARAGRPGVREFCTLERQKARGRIADLREKLRQEYRRFAYEERLGARGVCERARREPRLEIERLRIALAEERKFQSEMRRIAKGTRARRARRGETSARERRGESDDEVRANIPEDLIPLFERVKRSIKAGPRISRTERFLQYAEENPREQYEAIEDKTDALVRELERRQRRGY